MHRVAQNKAKLTKWSIIFIWIVLSGSPQIESLRQQMVKEWLCVYVCACVCDCGSMISHRAALQVIVNFISAHTPYGYFVTVDVLCITCCTLAKN